MHPSLDSVARTLGVTADRVRLELQRAIRRSEPDARLEGEQDGGWGKVAQAIGV